MRKLILVLLYLSCPFFVFANYHEDLKREAKEVSFINFARSQFIDNNRGDIVKLFIIKDLINSSHSQVEMETLKVLIKPLFVNILDLIDFEIIYWKEKIEEDYRQLELCQDGRCVKEYLYGIKFSETCIENLRSYRMEFEDLRDSILGELR